MSHSSGWLTVSRDGSEAHGIRFLDLRIARLLKPDRELLGWIILQILAAELSEGALQGVSGVMQPDWDSQKDNQ